MNVQLGVVADVNTFGKVMAGAWLKRTELADAGLKLIRRSFFKCKGCGFQSRPSQQQPAGFMVPFNTNHPAGLVINENHGTCLCPFCASAFAANWSVVPPKSNKVEMPAPGQLIYLPHMSQAQVNLLALHVISVLSSRKISTQTKAEAIAVNIDSTMKSLSKDLPAALPIFRDGHDEAFARALALLPQEFYEQRSDILSPVRWWPNASYWRVEGVYWMQSTFCAMQNKHPGLGGN